MMRSLPFQADGQALGGHPATRVALIMVAAGAMIALFTIVAALIAGPRLIVDLPKLVRPDLWTAFKVHAVADDIGNQVRNAGLDGPLATLTPIYALEAGLDIPAELAGGPFFYRIGDYLPASERERYNLPSPSNIADIFEKNLPAAILVGFEGALDAPLADYAETHGYTLLERAFGKDRYGTGRLYLAPSAAHGAGRGE